MNPPSKNPSDSAKYRQQYINNLRLQSSNDQLNLNANQIYHKTGQTPAPLPDVRSTTEKEADVEKLRIEVRSQLKELMDGENANNAVYALNPKQLVFAANHMAYMKADLKPKYALGVPSQLFVEYLRKLMEKEAKTNGVDLGLQQETGENILLSNQQIINTLVSSQSLRELQELLRHTPHSASLDRAIRGVMTLIPDESVRRQLFERLDEDDHSAQESLNDAVQHIPTQEEFDELMRRLKYAISINDTESEQSIMRVMEEILQPAEVQYLQADIAQQKLNRPSLTQVVEEPDEEVVNEAVPTEPVRRKGHKNKRQEVVELMNKHNMKTYGNYTTERILLDHNSKKGYIKAKDIDVMLEKLRNLEKSKTPEAKQEHRLSGTGLSSRKIPIVSTNEGITATNNYVPFGRYIIHRHHLSDNVVMLRHKRGGAIVSHPTTKVTPKLSQIFKTIIKNQKPSYDQMSSLSKDEHSYLHKVLHDSKLDDQLEISSPDKSVQEQENDRFEILKGEIRAGNDNAQLVKEFKLLLLKLIQEGRIPRRQGQEILVDLTSLGY